MTSRCWARSTAALADLEDETGGRAAAVRFEEVALGYKYQAGEPEACAISHHNLANYLERQGADPATVLAHRLAAAAICLQMQSGLLSTTLHNLANSDLPPAPPAFADVVQRVEAIEGVRFQALFERLPRTTPDGDAALAAVWQMVADEKRRRDEEKQRRDAVLASAPAAVRAAFELEGDEFAAALRAALAEMPEAEAAALKQRLREVGLISGSAGPDMAQVLQRVRAAAARHRRRGERRGTTRPDRAGTGRPGAEGLAADRGRPPHLGRRAGRGGAHRRAGRARHRAGAPRPGTPGTVRTETRS